MICNKCSQSNNENQIFCVYCGCVINEVYPRTNIAELSNNKKNEKGKESIYGYIALIIALLAFINQLFLYKNIVIGCTLGFIIWWLSEKSQDDLESISIASKVLAVLIIIIAILQQIIMMMNYF